MDSNIQLKVFLLSGYKKRSRMAPFVFVLCLLNHKLLACGKLFSKGEESAQNLN